MAAKVARVSNRGSKPGERRGGRKKGTLNKATAEIKDLAQEYAPAALRELARLTTGALSEAARVSAIKEILDRGYGKAPQALDHLSSDGSMTPASSGAIIEALERKHRDA